MSLINEFTLFNKFTFFLSVITAALIVTVFLTTRVTLVLKGATKTKYNFVQLKEFTQLYSSHERHFLNQKHTNRIEKLWNFILKWRIMEKHWKHGYQCVNCKLAFKWHEGVEVGFEPFEAAQGAGMMFWSGFGAFKGKFWSFGTSKGKFCSSSSLFWSRLLGSNIIHFQFLYLW